MDFDNTYDTDSSDSSDSSNSTDNEKEIIYLSDFDKETFDATKDKKRVRFLKKIKLLDTQPEYKFDKITMIAKKLFDVPVVLISLVDKKRQWFKSCIGLDIPGSNRKDAFCSITIKNDKVLVIHNAHTDNRVNKSIFVLGSPYINFYAGYPIKNKGENIGTICIIDFVDRDFTKNDEEQLIALASMVNNEIENINHIRLKDRENDIKNMMISTINNIIISELDCAVSCFPDIKKNNTNDETLNLLYRKITNSKLCSENILDIYKNNMNNLCINKTYVNVQDIALDIKQLNANIKFNIKDRCTVLCDREKIVRSLNNILNDSLRYTPKNAEKIQITILKINEYVKFIINDNGVRNFDMTKNYFDFSNIVKTNNETNDKTNNKFDDGCIGLYCCKIIIKKHDGDLWHEHKNKTGCYIFTIPDIPEGSLKKTYTKNN